MTIYNIPVKRVNWEVISLSEYRWKVLLIVNTATKCSLAHQFEELETLWNNYSHNDFIVLGFPCNQFMNQEPETDSSMIETCKINFWVTFPLFAKIDVNGEDTHPLYQYLKSQKWWLFSDAIKWNFTKFLIDRNWNIMERYSPTTSPLDIKNDIEKLLKK